MDFAVGDSEGGDVCVDGGYGVQCNNGRISIHLNSNTHFQGNKK
jgi:hypothetical protein